MSHTGQGSWLFLMLLLYILDIIFGFMSWFHKYGLILVLLQLFSLSPFFFILLVNPHLIFFCWILESGRERHMDWLPPAGEPATKVALFRI